MEDLQWYSSDDKKFENLIAPKNVEFSSSFDEENGLGKSFLKDEVGEKKLSNHGVKHSRIK